MTEQNIPEWLKTWQSEFRTCFDVWKEQKEYALTHQLSIYPAKTNGKWGLVDYRQGVMLPFEYDLIFRKPDSLSAFVLIKDGKQGLAYVEHHQGNVKVDIMVSVEMDAIYHVPGWEIALFAKNGKWGWWWYDMHDCYENYCDPVFDEVYIQPIEEVWEMEDDEDEIFTVRKGTQFFDILYWTIK